MTPAEKAAFVKAYSMNVAMVDDADVAAFLDRIDSGEDVEYSHDYTSIMDALGMWHGAIKWQMQQNKVALELAKAELYRHATDTESGERAITAVETALEKTA